MFNRITGLDRPWGFQKVATPRFQDSRHMTVVRLSALRAGCLYPPGNTPGTNFGWRLSHPQGHSALEGLCQWKIPMTPSGIEAETFWLVAQCLDQLRYRVLQAFNYFFIFHYLSERFWYLVWVTKYFIPLCCAFRYACKMCIVGFWEILAEVCALPAGFFI